MAAVVDRHRAVGLRLRRDIHELREVRQSLVALIGQADGLTSGLAGSAGAALQLHDLQIQRADLIQ